MIFPDISAGASCGHGLKEPAPLTRLHEEPATALGGSDSPVRNIVELNDEGWESGIELTQSLLMATPDDDDAAENADRKAKQMYLRRKPAQRVIEDEPTGAEVEAPSKENAEESEAPKKNLNLAKPLQGARSFQWQNRSDAGVSLAESEEATTMQTLPQRTTQT